MKTNQTSSQTSTRLRHLIRRLTKSIRMPSPKLTSSLLPKPISIVTLWSNREQTRWDEIIHSSFNNKEKQNNGPTTSYNFYMAYPRSLLIISGAGRLRYLYTLRRKAQGPL